MTIRRQAAQLAQQSRMVTGELETVQRRLERRRIFYDKRLSLAEYEALLEMEEGVSMVECVADRLELLLEQLADYGTAD